MPNLKSVFRPIAILATLLAAFAASQASAQITFGDGTNPAPVLVCPGGAATAADGFSLVASAAATVTRVSVRLSPAGSYQNIAKVEIRDGAGVAVFGSLGPQDDGPAVFLTTPGILVSTSPTNYRVYLTPRGQAEMPAGAGGRSVPVTAKVVSLGGSLPRTGSDANSATITIDNEPDADVRLTNVTSPNATSITLAWTPSWSTVVLRQLGGPVTDVPVDGTTYTAGATLAGGARVVQVSTASGLADTGLTASKPYHYKIYTRDACGNYSSGLSVGPVYPGGMTEGSTVVGNRPVVGILNPAPGAVSPGTSGFRVQVRIYSPGELALTVRQIQWDDGATVGTANLVKNANYAGGTVSGVYEATLTSAQLTAGKKYTLRASATNSAGNVLSGPVSVTVTSGKGDGNLLVRDNSTQLCIDCHNLPDHSSEELGNKYGSWFVGCRACHTPHGTTNASLIAERITPPAVGGQLPPAEVHFSTRTGYSGVSGATNPAAASFANSDSSGPCQVCHTRTIYFTRTGGGLTHNPNQNCASCHKHTDGFKGSGCDGCHGTTARTKNPLITGTVDSSLIGAPPRTPDTGTFNPATAFFVTNGGVHEAHVNQAEYRTDALACSDCHAGMAHDNDVVDLGWGATATADGASVLPVAGATTALWVSNPTCTNYCHGATMADGATPTKISGANLKWNTPVPTFGCNSCHGYPPLTTHSGAAHSTSTTCTTCHAGYSNAGLTAAAKITHLDGTAQGGGTSCFDCHGDSTRPLLAGVETTDDRYKSAPPIPAGGVHLSHMYNGTISDPFLCNDCHTPTPTSLGHSDGPVNFGFSALAGGAGVTIPVGPTWTCTSTYCHNPTPATPGTVPAPAWTTTALGCVGCHDNAATLTSGGHELHVVDAGYKGTTFGCVTCHTNATDSTITNKALHVDGLVNTAGTTFAAGACASNYCHSDGTETPGYRSVTWTAGAVGGTCIECHGAEVGAIAGAPWYTNVPADRDTANSHAKHVTAATDCVACHNTTVQASGALLAAGTQHLDSTRDVAGAAFTGYNESTETCTSVTCHNNGSPLGGTASAAGSPVWGATLGCTACHNNRGADQGGVATDLSAKHGKHLNQYTYTCDECHSPTMADNSNVLIASQANHGNSVKNVDFSTTAMLANINQLVGAYSGSGGTCSATYCHSGGVATVSPFSATASAAVAWTGTTTCRSCHGWDSAIAPTVGVLAGSSFQGSANHAGHVASVGVLGQNYFCGDCHSNVVAAGTNSPVTSFANHVNGTKQVSIANRGAFVSTDTTTTCAATYCHSSGQATPAYRTITWAGAAIGCNGCHGLGNASGSPDYASGAAGSATANSHAAHTSNGTDLTSCQDCHSGYVTAAGTGIPVGASHTNGARDIAILGTYDTNGATTNYTAATKTCASVSCHGAGTPQWGSAALKCSDCHVGAADTDSFAIGTAGIINSTEWTTSGHGQAVGALFTAGTVLPTIAAGQPCLYCHNSAVAHQVVTTTNPFRLNGVTNATGIVQAYSTATDGAANAACLNCHGTGSFGVNPAAQGLKTATKKIDSWHMGIDHTTNFGGRRCWDCHDPHGDANVAMVGKKAVRQPLDLHSFAGTRVPAAGTIAFTARTVGTDYVNGTFTGVCNVCHTTAAHYTATAGDGHQSAAKCVACHVHDDAVPANGFAQSTACNACHNSPPTVGNHTKHIAAISASPIYGSTVIGSSGVNYGYQCGVCHTTVAANHVNDIGGTVADPYNVNVTFSMGTVTTYTQGVTPVTETGATGLVFRGTNGSCTTVYCHDAQGATYASTAVTWTQAPGALACTACHAMGNAATTALPNAHAKHVTTAAGSYNQGCQKCHNSTTTTGNTITNAAQHAVNSHNVQFDSVPYAQPAATYTVGTLGACGSTYCHSSGVLKATPFSPTASAALAWTGTATCRSCHGFTVAAAPTIGVAAGSLSQGSANHMGHVANVGALGANYFCGDCHANVVAAGTDTPVTSVANHVNGTNQVSIANRGTFVSTDTTTTCAATYCHSSGQATPAYRSITWAGAVIGCNGCHGTGNAAGSPDYASGAAGSATANSHAAHTSNGTDLTSCQDCHSGYVTAAGTGIPVGASHTNGARDIAILGTYDTNGATTNYTAATKTCASVSCHGAGTPQWGSAALKCSDCHMGASDTDSFAIGTAGIINSTEWTTSGHGQAAGALFTAGTVLPTIAAGQPCLYCHNSAVTHQTVTTVNPFRLNGVTNATGIVQAYSTATDGAANAACLNCHGTGSFGVNPAAQGLKTATKKIDSWHMGVDHTTTFGGRRCWDCHDPHGDANVAMVGKKAVRQPLDLHSFAGTRVPAAGTVAFTARTVGTDYVNGTFTGVCNVCHTTAAHYTATAGDGHQSAAKCVACHVHDDAVPANGFAQSTACNACHNSPPTVGNHTKHIAAIQASPIYGSTVIGSSGVNYGYQCGVCHTTVAANHVDDIGGTAGDPYNVDVTFSMGTVTTYTQGVTPVTETGATGLVFRGTNGSCTTVYCHDAQGASYASTAVTWTQAPGALACTACHAMGNAATTALPNAHAKHVTTAAGSYNQGCQKCHNSTTTTGNTITNAAQHAINSHNVQFDSVPYAQPAATYTVGSLGACGSTYCHSSGVLKASPFSATASTALAWTGTATCRSCHGFTVAAAPTIGVAAGSLSQGSANHMGHVANATVLGANYFCGDCHATVVAAGTDTPVTSIALHVNGTNQISIANRGAFASTDTTTTCAATYCHSSGQATPAYRSITWAGAVIGCNGCHGTGNASGSPDYASGAAGSATANSHAKHTASGTDLTSCQDCHSGFVTAAGTGIPTGASHTNGARDIAILAGYDTNGATSNYNAGTKTCNSVSCHGAGTPQWGGAALLCSSCHGGAADVNNWATADGTISIINTGTEWTAYGHGNATAAFDEFTVAATNRCLYCHDDTVAHNLAANPFRLRGVANASGVTGVFAAGTNNGNGVCFNCHATSATVSYGVDPDGAGTQPRVCQTGGANACDVKVDSFHYGTYSGANHDATHDGGQRCWDCHDPHGDGVNLAMIGTDTLRDSTDVYGLTGSRSGVGAILTSRTAGNYAKTVAPWTGVCQVCHTTTDVFRADGTVLTHMTNDCMTCHDHNQAANTDAFKGSGECIQCHATAKTGTINRRAITTEFSATWSHKRSGGRTVSNADCAVCHMEATSPATPTMSAVHGDTFINLRDPDTGSNIQGVYWTGTGAGGYTSTTTYLSFTKFSRNLGSKTLEAAVQAIQINQCLKCHDTNGANHVNARVPGGSAGKPFNTTIAGAGYTGSGITALGSAGNVTDINASFNPTNSSVHPIKGKNNNWYARLSRMKAPWNSSTRVTAAASTNSWGEMLSCWDCHAPNGTASTVTLTSTVTAHGGATTLRASPTSTGTPAAGTSSALCMVCHSQYDTCGGAALTTCSTTTSHGAGSAFSSNPGRNEKVPFLNYGCNKCHASTYTTAAVRPIRAQDVHGFDRLPGTGTDLMWPTGVTETQKPYAFIRNTQAFSNHIVLRRNGAITTYTPTCVHLADGTCNSRTENYTVGGTY